MDASSVNDSSVLTVQIFDQKKFKVGKHCAPIVLPLYNRTYALELQRKDQGFLGVINLRVSSVLDLDLGGDGEPSFAAICLVVFLTCVL